MNLAIRDSASRVAGAVREIGGDVATALAWLERVKADRNQFDRDYFAPWLGALRNAMREHRIRGATTPRGKRTRPAVEQIGSSAALRRSPDAEASRVAPRLAE